MKQLVEYLKEIDIWLDWNESYRKYIPLFIEESKRGLNYTEWERDTFNEFFEKSNQQCVSSLRQGYFTNIEKTKIKENWLTIAPLLQKISNNDQAPAYELYDELKNTIRKYTNADRKAATNRMIAALQPQFLTTVINHNRLNELISHLNSNVENANIQPKSNWFESSHDIHQFFMKVGGFTDYYDMVTYPWQLLELFNNKKTSTKLNDMSEEVDILEILRYKKQIILQGPPGTGKTREAKILASSLIDLKQGEQLENQDNFKIIQFHPSYSYEDFVRGIVTKSNESNDGIVYEAQNKIIGTFAQNALENYELYHNPEKQKINFDAFELFIDHIKEKMINDDEHKYHLTDSVYIFSADETKFKYKGDNWNAHNKGLNIKYSELKKMLLAGVKERQDIKKMQDIEELSRQHATYFIKVIQHYYDFVNNQEFNTTSSSNTQLKNYVLIIDEINRANLSSVLGELIYALEYRGSKVDSMYKVDGSNKITLPPNLYIIGTMNTADRSVGHIDYAIRRRFAFVDILPKDLSSDENIKFDTKLFNEVAQLFMDNISLEFEIKDVQLGHSYFINKEDEGGSMKIRLEYEIKPILYEYVKDGVLITKDGNDIKDKIKNLETSL